MNVYNNAWKPLKQFVSHVHVKDWVEGRLGSREGIGCIEPILAELAREGYEGFLTLEPHLEKGGPSGGFSGLDNFEAGSQRPADHLPPGRAEDRVKSHLIGIEKVECLR